MTQPPFTGLWLGTRPYAPIYQLQGQLLELRKQGQIADCVLFLEHSPTITLGKGAHSSHLLLSEQALENRGISVHRVDRGGDITLHAPGQLVAYPIVSLADGQKDVRKYVQALTEVMRRLILPFGIRAGTLSGKIGLWANAERYEHWEDGVIPARPAKLGAIGVRISKWVTMHGFALNLSTDLSLFQTIIPCGISEYGVASVESLTGQSPNTQELAEQAFTHLSEVLGRRPNSLLRVLEAEDLTERVLAHVGRADANNAAISME